MSEKTSFFMTGVTGFIGGTVLDKFLSHPKASSFDITALVRDRARAEKLKQFGVTPIIGSLSDVDTIKDAASNADVVVTMANVDDLTSAEAILHGLRKRYEKTGMQSILIHTSGTGVLGDDAAGEYATDTIYDDANPDQIETLAPSQPHRPVDLKVVEADKKGYVKTYIILPSTIYGVATGKLADAGVHNVQSIQIPSIISASLDRGRAGMVGKGKNLWPNVEVHEQADLFITLYDAIVNGSSNPALGHGREGFYFGASGEHSLYDIGKAVGQALVEAGKATDPEPTTFTKEEIDKYFGGNPYLGSNSRCRANRSKAIGWDPKKTTEDLLKSIQAEVKLSIKRGYAPALR